MASQTNQKSDSSKKRRYDPGNILETLRSDLGGGFVSSVKNDAKRLPGDFVNELLGLRIQKRSGEIQPGQSIEMKDVLSGKQEEQEKLASQLAFERRIRGEEKEVQNKHSQELTLQLHAIKQEIQKLAKATPELAQEVEIATMQAPTKEPGIYHLVFFSKLLEFIKSFKKKIEDASTWLHALNTRSSKKSANVWGARYKKSGAKYLLSGEHYLTRSAG